MPPSRALLLDLLKKYGRGTMSFQVLEPGLEYWLGDDACVAYADTGGSWVAVGAPIAASEREADVLAQFSAAARRAGKRVRFFGLEETPALASELTLLHIGQQPVWNPQRWSEVVAAKRSLREQLRRARAKGVRVRQVEPSELSDPSHRTRRAVEVLAADWQSRCPMAPMGFVVGLDLYSLPDERRFLVAEREGELLGVLVAVPIYALGGWFFEDVLRASSAPNGTVELLFDHAMRTLASAGCGHVTFGLAPLSGSDRRWICRVRRHTSWLYSFEGLRAFKAKLQPTSWRPVYLGFPTGEGSVRPVIDTLRAFAHGSFLRFGARTLAHRASLVTRWARA